MPNGQIKAAIFDFDGTFSTLRCGWETVMQPLMLEMISGSSAEKADSELVKEVNDYIDSSTGIQTIYQMQWLRKRVDIAGKGNPERDEWWYKAEYNRRLMLKIQGRINALKSGKAKPEDYLIKGCIEFITQLKNKGVELFLASGTDHKDVLNESNALGADKYFSLIKGAPENMAACSKEAVIRMILEEKKIKGSELLVVGDGKVEIALGKAANGFALGAATDENNLCGLNPVKYKRLVNAGADAVTGDFTPIDEIMQWLGF